METSFRRGSRWSPGMRAVVLVLVWAAACSSQKQKLWDREDDRDEERLGSRSCSNLTLVLDNWKFAIMTQVRDLLLQDHSTVLPDYGRIQPLSAALGDLYGEFNALKEHLSRLTARFEAAEAFVDQVRSGRSPAPPGGSARLSGPPAGPQGRRTRVVVRRIQKPAGDQEGQGNP